ncbi:MAG: FAD-dependent oxidoreductase [Bacteroidetes bacterium]|nr:FAD-dependent oxidoreductase [Bacteroidota bacterium]
MSQRITYVVHRRMQTIIVDMHRRHFLKTSLLSAVGSGMILSACSSEEVLRADVAIIGGGTGGVAAALAAARRGMNVIMTDESDWFGGQLTSQGVPPDEHSWVEKQGVPISYRAFRERVRAQYASNWGVPSSGLNPGQCGVSRICHAPIVAHTVLAGMLAQYAGKIKFIPECEPILAGGNRDRIDFMKMQSLQTGAMFWIEAPFYIDATERGDLLPLTGAEYVTGSEGQAAFGEPHATAEPDPSNEQAFTWCAAVGFDTLFESSPSRAPGGIDESFLQAPDSYTRWRSFVPDLQPAWPGKMLNLTYSHPITLEPRTVDFDPRPGAQTTAFNLWAYRRLQTAGRTWPVDGGVTLLNWPQNDYLSGRLIDVNPAERARHEAEARDLTKCLIHWLRTEAPRPDGGRGWPGLFPVPDILGTPDGLAKRPYIRESRRIRARTTVHEHHVGEEARLSAGLTEAEHFPDTVGVGHYRIDLHPSTAGNNYIDVASLPFEIPLGSLIPIRVANLIAGAKNIGTTHVTNGCYRLHPVEWSVGEAAGALAAACHRTGEDPAAIHSVPEHLEDLQRDLVRGGAQLRWRPA